MPGSGWRLSYGPVGSDDGATCTSMWQSEFQNSWGDWFRIESRLRNSGEYGCSSYYPAGGGTPRHDRPVGCQDTGVGQVNENLWVEEPNLRRIVDPGAAVSFEIPRPI